MGLLMSFVPIRMSTLRGDLKIEFDTYIKINDKHILYLRRGDSFEGPRLKRLKDKKLKKMFIRDEEEGSYRSYLAHNIDTAYDPKSGKSMETRCEIIQGQQQANAEAVMEIPDSPETYAIAKDDAARFVKFLSTEDKGLAHILAQENLDKNIAHHGVTVATLATGIAKRTGKFDARQMQMISLGSLIHDVEHFYSAVDIARSRLKLTPEELIYYESHPTEGARRLSEKKHFDSQVIKIIAQHEEYIDGSGFPVGLKEGQLDELAIVVSSANALDRLMTFEGVPRKDAVKTLTIKHVGCHPIEHIQILGDLLNQLA